LGKDSKVCGKTEASVKILGSKEKLKWNQQADALVISKPSNLPEWEVVTLKVEFKK
jgi:alpha-L-fucosidase